MSDLIRYYILLSLRRIQRKCQELKLPVYIIIPLAVGFFIIGCHFIYYKSPDFAAPIIVLIAFTAIHFIIDLRHLSHLKSVFNSKESKIIRILEHFTVSLPFALFLLFKMDWLWLGILLIGQCLQALLPARLGTNFKIPTPFSRKPFEYIVGFRKTWALLLLAYFLMFKAIQVDNANLGFSMIGFIFLLSIGYQLIIEDSYFVWIHNKSPQQLLKMKILTSFRNTTLLSIPGSIILLVFFPSFFLAILIIYLYGFVLLTTFILSKYAAFPDEISLPQVIILGISILLPPVLLYTIPAFYKKACQNLRPYLIC